MIDAPSVVLSKFTVVGLGALCFSPAPALEVRGYSAERHDRFLGSPTEPAANPAHLFADLDLTGVGWLAAVPSLQPTLVSRQHLLFATHFVQENQAVRFLSASGQIVTRSYTSSVVVMDDGQPSDLSLLTLDSPIDAADQVSPLPFLDLPSADDYLGLPLVVLGQSLRAGRGTIAHVESGPRSLKRRDFSLNPTRFMRFDYNTSSGDADDSQLQIGDSGSPSLVESDGRAALVGTHVYTGQMWSIVRNYDAFNPHYVGELDRLMAPGG